MTSNQNVIAIIMSTTCIHCHKLNDQLPSILADIPMVKIKKYFINDNYTREYLQSRISDPINAVPDFYVENNGRFKKLMKFDPYKSESYRKAALLSM